MSIDSFSEFVFEDGEISHPVFLKGSGPAVVLCHELPGMTQQCIDFAEEIAAKGFSVFLPLLFGDPEDDHPVLFTAQLCISREFKLFAEHGGSPIVDWLRALCRKAHAECGGPGVGVIGMCLTGNFVISLMADASVLAAVASQPALPFGVGHHAHAALGVPESDVARAKARGLPLMCLRFSNDAISPRERYDAFRDTFGPAFKGIEINSAPGNAFNISPKAHSVLTKHFIDQAGHPTRQARDEVLRFLGAELR